MIEFEDWEFPEGSRPRDEDVAFDLDGALASVVSLRTEIPDDAYTASILGTERGGNGVVISDTGLVLTIGYLITEAETIWLVANNGTAVPAHIVGYDQASGFGLVQALGRLGVSAIPRGSADDVKVGGHAVIAGHGGRRHAVLTEITSKHEFAGYWEYVLDEAIFTAPAHPLWGGTALIGDNGKLVGIGSLLIQQRYEDDETVDSNMFVPIDLLEPILDDLMKFGFPLEESDRELIAEEAMAYADRAFDEFEEEFEERPNSPLPRDLKEREVLGRRLRGSEQ